MKPTREQIEKIILEDQKSDKLIETLTDAISLLSPSSYRPMIDVFDVLYPVKILYPDIYDCISYWKYECYGIIWEVQNMDWKSIKIVWWSIKSLKKYLEWEWLIE